MKAIRVHDWGGPEVMKLEDVPMPAAGKGEAVVKIAASGVNFIDVYFRSGVSKEPQMPYIPGREASGTVQAVGEGVTEVRVGDRVAFAVGHSSYAEYVAIAASRLVPIP